MQEVTCSMVGADGKVSSNNKWEKQAPTGEVADSPEPPSSDSRVHDVPVGGQLQHAGGEDAAILKQNRLEDTVMDSPVEEVFPSLPPSRSGQTKNRKQMARDLYLQSCRFCDGLLVWVIH